jgi:type II secretory pathway component PulF
LRVIADRREKRSAYLMTAMLHIIYPLAIVFIGMIVAFFCAALFIPIVNLIHGLSY